MLWVIFVIILSYYVLCYVRGFYELFTSIDLSPPETNPLMLKNTLDMTPEEFKEWKKIMHKRLHSSFFYGH